MAKPPIARHLPAKLLLLLFAFSFLAGLAQASSHAHGYHGHQHHVRQSESDGAAASASVPAPAPFPSPDGLEEARRMVKEAHAALGVMNKGRLAYPHGNTYEFQSSSSAGEDFKPAPALDDTMAALARPSVFNFALNGTIPKQETAKKFTYTISPELAEAARMVAEASPEPLPDNDGVDVDVAAVIEQYRPRQPADTNRPEQKYQHSNGLDGYIHADEVAKNDPGSRTELKKRAAPDFWLTTMAQRGSSPWAPEGYKVWRNVKDYGAKGDGVTDDTAAINLAISDGGRCGANCGSSTIYPAFVYFPLGTYLVSSSIIQYYNTEFYGNPFDYPTILAASSFVGLGVITSDVYTGETSEWYINTNNFLRSIRNFKIDVTRTEQSAYVCGIHWQVAQGTSLENIIFYMSQDAATTQQGIYMENGSGGFLTNLTFVGGNFGAYFGNQQFTTTQLTFKNAKNALQIHWDWAWTMQDLIIHNCTNGIVIVGGAGGPGSTGQSVGSLLVLDALISFTDTAILTSLLAENSTSFLIQNSQFIAVDTTVYDNAQGRTLLAGGNLVTIDSWGFGRVATSSTNTTFYSGANVPGINRTDTLTGDDGWLQKNFFQRRRPSYTAIGTTQVIDVKAWGAVGDGVTDDAPILNSILDRAANMSAIVFFPFGAYVIKDTLHVPVGSRIVGQAWSQIMAKGPKFQKELQPRVAVQVGRPGDVGIIEIQSMMFTVSGPTAGAILMEWNVHESTKGSAGMWDSHFRVGGATGSLLRSVQCPKNDGTANTSCKGASLLLHLTAQSSAYLENIWAWTADHDLDKKTQDQINVYSARGILVESQGPTWMYGTASEHNVLYQYQLSSAKDLYMSMIQTESPYFHPVPKAPRPFSTGLFANDPVFTGCPGASKTCAVAWALRVLDSTSVYIMGAGLYSWFSNYTQDCLVTENCQQRAVEISQSTDMWMYNLVTKGIVEMVSPVNETPTLAADNVNGFMSSILAWVREADSTIGQRTFPGFQLYRQYRLSDLSLTSECKTALSEKILCDSYLSLFQSPGIGKRITNATLADSVCDAGCGTSLKGYYDNVAKYCTGQLIGDLKPTSLGGAVWANYNMTCLRDPATDRYCIDVLYDSPLVRKVSDMALEDMCAYCFTTLLAMQQASPYAYYDERNQRDLETVQANCDLTGPTDLHEPLYVADETPDPICASDILYTTKEGDTCDSIALEYKLASASILYGNPTLIARCSILPVNATLCLPLSCETQYTLTDTDTCQDIEWNLNLRPNTVRKYNSWIDAECTKLQPARLNLGNIICLSPQGGVHSSVGSGETKSPGGSSYANGAIPPPADATVAPGTARSCGVWYTAVSGDECVSICLQQNIAWGLFLAVNPSLSSVAECDANLVVGNTYCVGPTVHWADEE